MGPAEPPHPLRKARTPQSAEARGKRSYFGQARGHLAHVFKSGPPARLRDPCFHPRCRRRHCRSSPRGSALPHENMVQNNQNRRSCCPSSAAHGRAGGREHGTASAAQPAGRGKGSARGGGGGESARGPHATPERLVTSAASAGRPLAVGRGASGQSGPAAERRSARPRLARRPRARGAGSRDALFTSSQLSGPAPSVPSRPVPSLARAPAAEPTVNPGLRLPGAGVLSCLQFSLSPRLSPLPPPHRRVSPVLPSAGSGARCGTGPLPYSGQTISGRNQAWINGAVFCRTPA
ncbi:protein-L-isoaspartate O-methyltransferase domain-containing protein 1 isoform X3 [Poecile atricapillus]|uniref:protein-L-isoaspartate O-methyltransferase domain-containing protein 1 isoform X3 n=1 Tax=Poecile atricapillus TaxID=48891 RepID=UPI00273857B9|nr:protein-L-isoaspartate O-methyltransferase domain-containing protein 1 isoform X3 [Poecile atricapillus]